MASYYSRYIFNSTNSTDNFTSEVSKKGVGLFKEIDAPEVMEILSEEFGIFPFDCMEKFRCVAYGGSLRDVLAGLPIGGDLDIAADRSTFRMLSSMFDENPKFARCVKQKSKDGTEKILWAAQDSPSTIALPRHGYGDAPNVPVRDEVRFLRYDGAEVNLVQAKRFKSSEFEDEVNVVMNVDIVCCGIAMDGEGRVYEVVKGAYEDCKKRVLRLNPKAADAIDIRRTEERVKRLEERGWKSEVDLAGLKEKRKKEEAMKKAELAKRRKDMADQKSSILEDKIRSLKKRRDKLNRKINEMMEEGVSERGIRREMQRRDRVVMEITRLKNKKIADEIEAEAEKIASTTWNSEAELRRFKETEEGMREDIRRLRKEGGNGKTVEKLTLERRKISKVIEKLSNPNECKLVYWSDSSSTAGKDIAVEAVGEQPEEAPNMFEDLLKDDDADENF